MIDRQPKAPDPTNEHISDLAHEDVRLDSGPDVAGGDLQADGEEIRRTLALLHEAGSVVELRVLGKQAGTKSGYFDDFDEAVAAAARVKFADGVFHTINPVHPDLLARARNRLDAARQGQTTGDGLVTRRATLFWDFDPVRLAGISSTDAEHEAAVARARGFQADLARRGIVTALADSGNGAHVIARIDLPNDEEASRLVTRCLEAGHFKYSDERVVVDTSVGNAARICKLYGTVSRKGDATPERPHRLSRWLDVPDDWPVTPRGLLEALASEAPPAQEADERPKSGTYRVSDAFDVEGFLDAHEIDVFSRGAWKDGRKWVLAECPFDADHTDRTAYIVQFADGAVAAGCHHNSCTWTWRDIRARYDPGYADRQQAGGGATGGNADRPDGMPLIIRVEDLRSRPKLDLVYLPLLKQEGYFVKGWSHLLSGKPRMGKTELVTALCREWVDEGYRILYLTEESELLWAQRLPKLPQSGMAFIFALGRERKELLDAAFDGPYDIVVVDTWRSLFPVEDETNNSQVNKNATQVISRSRQAGKTLLVTHHNRKKSGEHGDAIAGGHALLASFDIGMELGMDSMNPAARSRRQIAVYPRVISPPVFRYERLADGTFIARTDILDRILEVLTANEREARTEEAVTDATGLPRTTVQRELARGVEKGHIKRGGKGVKGNPYLYWAARGKADEMLEDDTDLDC